MAAPYPTARAQPRHRAVTRHGRRCGIIAAVVAVSDRELAIRFPAADDAVLRDVYARFGGAVYTVALSILGDPGRAADVVQSTFVNAWQAAARFNPDQELAPWLYTIARRQAIDAYRRERRTHAVDAAELDDAQAAVSLEATWEAWQVRIALDQLPDDERQVVRLSWFDGLAHAEIADKLGVPVGTVKSRSHRAHRTTRRTARLCPRSRRAVRRSPRPRTERRRPT